MSFSRKFLMFGLVVVFGLAGFVGRALAATPQLSVNFEGSYLRVIVSGADPFAQVTLNTRDQGTSLWTVITNFGTTDQSGYMSQVFGSSSSSAQFYVTVNGQQSATVTPGGGSGCIYSSCFGGNISFSPSSVNINVGQSMNVSIFNASGSFANSFYISSNSNSSVASANISGSSLNVFGISNGSTTMMVCSNIFSGSTSNCGSLFVTVGNGSGGGQLSLSQTSVSLNSGQSATVTAYNSFGSSIYISSNSNPSVVSATVSGNLITLYGNSSGSSTISVCANSFSTCASIFVTVNGNSTGQITFSQNNVFMTTGQTMSVSVSAPYFSSFYISSNSNSGVVSATMSGNAINLFANSSGSSTILVCSSGGGACGSLFVTVNGFGGGNGQISLSPSSLNLNSGSSGTVSVFSQFGFTPYISSNSNPNAASASIFGNTMTVVGSNSGNTTIIVCANSVVQCASLYVTVNGNNNCSNYYNIYGCNNGSLSISPSTLPQPIVGTYYSQQLQGIGGSAPYMFAITSGFPPVGLNLSSSGLLYGMPAGVGATSFTVRVTDSFGRVGSMYYTLSPNSSGGGGSAQLYANGTLLNDSGTIFMVYKNMRTGFTNYAAFLGMGFRLGMVISGSASGLVDSGYTVSSASAAHPWGSWIKIGQTVYFVHQDGLIAIPSWDIFLNNGGNGSLIVPANQWDTQRSILSVMTWNDSRMQ